MRQHVLLVGVSHRTAPIGVRDRLAGAIDDFGLDLPHVVLSTCNRVELYTAADDIDDARGRIVAELAQAARVTESLLAAATDEHAVSHLFRVAAGLDSPIVGEPQILGQVRRAAATACGEPLLDRLFASAVHAGRRARNETSLGERPGSLAIATADLAAACFPGLSGRRVLVIGAGAIGELVASCFGSRDCDVVVMSRTRERAEALAARIHGRAAGLDVLHAELATADVLVSCTRCPDLVVTAADITAARRCADEQLLAIDLAVPHDIDPAVAMLPSCRLHDLDAVNALAHEVQACAAADVTPAETIVAAEVDRFLRWSRSRAVAAAITSLHSRAEAIRSAELARMHAKLDELSPEQRRAVETVTAQIVNKLLHTPTVRIKERTGQQLVPALCRLFALEEAA